MLPVCKHKILFLCFSGLALFGSCQAINFHLSRRLLAATCMVVVLNNNEKITNTFVWKESGDLQIMLNYTEIQPQSTQCLAKRNDCLISKLVMKSPQS